MFGFFLFLNCPALSCLVLLLYLVWIYNPFKRIWMVYHHYDKPYYPFPWSLEKVTPCTNRVSDQLCTQQVNDSWTNKILLKLIACRDSMDQKKCEKNRDERKDVCSTLETWWNGMERWILYICMLHPEFSVVMCATHVHVHRSVVFLCFPIEVRWNSNVVGVWSVYKNSQLFGMCS